MLLVVSIRVWKAPLHRVLLGCRHRRAQLRICSLSWTARGLGVSMCSMARTRIHTANRGRLSSAWVCRLMASVETLLIGVSLRKCIRSTPLTWKLFIQHFSVGIRPGLWCCDLHTWLDLVAILWSIEQAESYHCRQVPDDDSGLRHLQDAPSRYTRRRFAPSGEQGRLTWTTHHLVENIEHGQE